MRLERSSIREAVRLITSGMNTRELTGATLWIPFFLSHLARAYIALGNFEDARRSIREAITTVETTQEAWCEADRDAHSNVSFGFWSSRPGS